ncbi:MAG: hypothetical protein ACYTBS_19820, partial [Planctomycetota bacterium]
MFKQCLLYLFTLLLMVSCTSERSVQVAGPEAYDYGTGQEALQTEQRGTVPLQDQAGDYGLSGEQNGNSTPAISQVKFV